MPRIEVSDIPVSYVETAEYLGVTLDSKFTWKPQVEAVTKKVNRAAKCQLSGSGAKRKLALSVREYKKSYSI